MVPDLMSATEFQHSAAKDHESCQIDTNAMPADNLQVVREISQEEKHSSGEQIYDNTPAQDSGTMKNVVNQFQEMMESLKSIKETQQ